MFRRSISSTLATQSRLGDGLARLQGSDAGGTVVARVGNRRPLIGVIFSDPASKPLPSPDRQAKATSRPQRRLARRAGGRKRVMRQSLRSWLSLDARGSLRFKGSSFGHGVQPTMLKCGARADRGQSGTSMIG